MNAQWTARIVRIQRADVVICTLYLATGLGIEGTNYQTLLEVGSYIRAMNLNFSFPETLT